MTGGRFPDGFLWGAATAAHQVEGDNTNSDWWQWEHRAGSPVHEPSGRACEHYTRYAEDIALLAKAGLNTYRYSVEWARIEPSEGEFDLAQLDHYRAMTEAVRAAGVTPMVTLHHFTLPAWLADRGGWTHTATPDLFGRYCDRVVRHLGDAVDWWCTINEPGNVAVGGYLGLFGWPPGTRDYNSWQRAADGLRRGHLRALDVVKGARPQARVGATHGMQEWEANAGGRPAMEHVRWMLEDLFLEASRDDDYVGVQTYTRVPVVVPSPLGLLMRVMLGVDAVRRVMLPPAMRRTMTRVAATGAGDGVRRTQMGYEFRPQAIAATLRRAAALLPGMDLVVTEHGIATDDDTERIEFLRLGLDAVHDVVRDGVPVRGYIYWSLLDNFEWAHGYRTRFGLVDIDRATLARRPRPSLRFVGDIARANTLG